MQIVTPASNIVSCVRNYWSVLSYHVFVRDVKIMNALNQINNGDDYLNEHMKDFLNVHTQLSTFLYLSAASFKKLPTELPEPFL